MFNPWQTKETFRWDQFLIFFFFIIICASYILDYFTYEGVQGLKQIFYIQDSLPPSSLPESLTAHFGHRSPHLQGALFAHKKSCQIVREQLSHSIRQRQHELGKRELIAVWISTASLVEAPRCFWLLGWKRVTRYTWNYSGCSIVWW